MKTEHLVAARRYLLLLILVPTLILVTNGCNSAYSGGGGNAPYISGLSVNSGAVGAPVTITGTKFGATQGSSTVTFNGTVGAPTSWSDTGIVVPVPAGATTGPLVVTVGSKASNGVTFTVTSAAPASITASAGTSQSATVNTAFATQLQVTVKDSGSNPVSGATVTFAAPSSGATGTFAGGMNTATTDAQGVATAAVFTANTIAGGPYTVTASVSGVSTPANFSLTNLPSSSGSSAGWTFIQDNPIFFCQSSTGCSGGSFVGNMTPTVAGSIWILEVQAHGNFAISSVSGGGATWTHCPNCYASNPNGYNADAWYGIGGNAGENGSHLSFTLSPPATSNPSVNFVEVLPPPGATPIFDTSGTAAPTNCSGTSPIPCTAATVTITGTDVIIQNPGSSTQGAWNAWSAPYITTANGSGIALNVAPGTVSATMSTAPCGPPATTCNPEFFAMAFKSSAGIFTPPTKQYSIVQVALAMGPAQQSGGGLNCSSGCNVPLTQATTAGDLLFVDGNSAQGGVLTGITCAPVACTSGASAPVIPTGNNSSVCQRSDNNVPGVSNATFSCGWILNLPAGVTSITVTASNSSSFTVTAVEVASNMGSTWVLDAQGSTQLSAGAIQPVQALTLTGGNDVIFSMFWANGGNNAPNYYPYLNLNWYCTGGGGTFPCNPLDYTMFNQAGIAILLDSGPTPPSAFWVNPQNTADLVTGVAFNTH